MAEGSSAPVEVADGIWRIDAPFFGVPLMLWLIDGGSELALVDSGIATTPDRHIQPALAAFGRNPGLLINTHGHVDHFGGNARMREVLPDLRVVAHEIDARWIEDVRRHLAEFYMQMPDDWQFEDGGAGLLSLCGANSAVDVRVRHGEEIVVGRRRFVAHHSTGHSPGHITLFEPETGIAICGDAALGWGPATDADAPDAPCVYTDADAYLAGVAMLEALDARLYCTGHFGALDRAGMGRICDDSRDFVARFDAWTLEAIAEGPRTLADIARFVGDRIPSYEFGFHIHASSQASLLRHARDGRAATVMVDGRRHFRLP